MPQLIQSTAINYYQILGVTQNASLPQICQSYRSIALKNHPSLQHSNKNQAYHIFCQASEAFDVLYDSQKRQIYDKYGDQVLKQGLIINGQLQGKYKFTTDPEEVFEKFFGSNNVYDHLLEIRKGDSINHPIFASQYSDNVAQKNIRHLIVSIGCTLTQLFNGCTKTVTYGKNILSADGQTTQHINETKTIEILPGSSSQTDIVFKGQGHHQPGYPPSNLIFKIFERPQKRFKRKGDDLYYEEPITLMQALDSKSITITQLNGQIIQIHFDEIISPQTKRVIKGKGMPINGSFQSRGDLIVTFDIEFPQQLSLQKKKQIVKLLKEN